MQYSLEYDETRFVDCKVADSLVARFQATGLTMVDVSRIRSLSTNMCLYTDSSVMKMVWKESGDQGGLIGRENSGFVDLVRVGVEIR